MKKVSVILFYGLLVLSFAWSKPPKIKESNFAKDSYLKKVIEGYNLQQKNISYKKKSVSQFEYYVNEETGDYLIYLEDDGKTTKNKFVGTYIGGDYKSRTWFERTFNDGVVLEGAVYEDSPELRVGGSNGDYYLNEYGLAQFYISCIYFRCYGRKTDCFYTPEKILEKDREHLEVLQPFFKEKDYSKEKQLEIGKILGEITRKYN